MGCTWLRYLPKMGCMAMNNHGDICRNHWVNFLTFFAPPPINFISLAVFCYHRRVGQYIF